jgi:hypothetical protein
MDIIPPPAFYLKCNVSETALGLRLQVKPTKLCLRTGIQFPKCCVWNEGQADGQCSEALYWICNSWPAYGSKSGCSSSSRHQKSNERYYMFLPLSWGTCIDVRNKPQNFGVVWDLTPCGLIDVYWRFGWSYCLHHCIFELFILRLWCETYVLSKRR